MQQHTLKISYIGKILERQEYKMKTHMKLKQNKTEP
jgi:hypothetical protein